MVLFLHPYRNTHLTLKRFPFPFSSAHPSAPPLQHKFVYVCVCVYLQYHTLFTYSSDLQSQNNFCDGIKLYVGPDGSVPQNI